MHANRSDLIAIVADKTQLDEQTVRVVFDTLVESIIQLLKTDHIVSIYRFGVFQNKFFKSRVKRDPNTKQEAILPGRFLPKFTFSSTVTSDLKK